MTITERIKALGELGKRLREINKVELEELMFKARSENAWFTPENIERAWAGITHFLDEESLRKWIKPYNLPSPKNNTIAIVMAGNIPLVGFHDLLCVLISGNNALIKLSSKDSILLLYILSVLKAVSPALYNQIKLTDRLKDFDGVIATGSDNTSRYFEYYFGKYPHIIRKNRTSCAIITGNESDADLKNLGTDVFSYFGLGCRNVSKLYVPSGYIFSPLLKCFDDNFKSVVDHHKYCNNYDYQKSIMLVNGVTFLDNGSIMVTENERTVSPISVLYYETYNDQADLLSKITAVNDKLQCIVGVAAPATIPFGQAQFPELWDYADQVDTLKFLSDLN
jgi:hypothetical protein